MKNHGYKWGVYFNNFKPLIAFEVGVIVHKEEKYIHFSFIYWELAIGKTSRS